MSPASVLSDDLCVEVQAGGQLRAVLGATDWFCIFVAAVVLWLYAVTRAQSNVKGRVNFTVWKSYPTFKKGNRHTC